MAALAAPVTMVKSFALLAGKSHPDLARGLAGRLGVKLVNRVSNLFANGEHRVQIFDSVRGKDLFILQTANTGKIAGDLEELRRLIGGATVDPPREITLIIPCLPYGRQERIDKPGVPISAADLALEIAAVGRGRIKQLVTFDLHEQAIEGFWHLAGISPGHFTTRQLFVDYCLDLVETNKIDLTRTVFAAPDVGRLKDALKLAELVFDQAVSRYGFEVKGTVEENYFVPAVKQGRDPKTGETRVLLFTDLDLKDKTVIIDDDMIDRGGTMKGAVKAFLARGAKEIYIMATHPVFSPIKKAKGSRKNIYASQRLSAIPQVKKIVVTNTLNIPEAVRTEKLKIISIGEILAKIVESIFSGTDSRDAYRYTE